MFPLNDAVIQRGIRDLLRASFRALRRHFIFPVGLADLSQLSEAEAGLISLTYLFSNLRINL
jgi:hypothetical protein